MPTSSKHNPNDYEHVEAAIQGKKALGEGDTWPDGKKATFTLTAVTEGAPMPAEAADCTRELTAPGIVTFGEITYGLEDAGKSYDYRVTEASDWGTGWTVAPTEVIATVTVSADDGTGLLTTTVTYSPRTSPSPTTTTRRAR